jgi:hypothetical protein
MPRIHQRLHLLDGIQRAAPGTVGILLRLQVGLEDRLQDRQYRRLRDTILDRRYAQRPKFAIRLRDVHPPDGLRTIRLLTKFFRQFTQPLHLPILLDVLERLAVHAWGTVVDTTALVGVPQHIHPVHLVIERIEAVRGCTLRFGMQRLL